MEAHFSSRFFSVRVDVRIDKICSNIPVHNIFMLLVSTPTHRDSYSKMPNTNRYCGKTFFPYKKQYPKSKALEMQSRAFFRISVCAAANQ